MMKLNDQMRLIGEEKLSILQEYLKYHKYTLIEASFKTAKTVRDIAYADGGINAINILIHVFENCKEKKQFTNQITGKVQTIKPKSEEDEIIIFPNARKDEDSLANEIN